MWGEVGRAVHPQVESTSFKSSHESHILLVHTHPQSPVRKRRKKRRKRREGSRRKSTRRRLAGRNSCETSSILVREHHRPSTTHAGCVCMNVWVLFRD